METRVENINFEMEEAVKLHICEIGKRIYMNGFVAANDGNITVKIDENQIITTPTGVSKGFMTPEMLIKVNMEGEVLAANSSYKPSSELKMHLRVYRDRTDVNAVVHAHPPYATAFAIAGIPLDRPISAEAVVALGAVPLAKFGMPSTYEVPEAIAQYLPNYDAILLANHGALSYGVDLLNAYYKMESLEFYAKLTFMSTQLGGPKELSALQVERLYEMRRKMALPGRHPADNPIL